MNKIHFIMFFISCVVLMSSCNSQCHCSTQQIKIVNNLVPVKDGIFHYASPDSFYIVFTKDYVDTFSLSIYKKNYKIIDYNSFYQQDMCKQPEFSYFRVVLPRKQLKSQIRIKINSLNKPIFRQWCLDTSISTQNNIGVRIHKGKGYEDGKMNFVFDYFSL